MLWTCAKKDGDYLKWCMLMRLVWLKSDLEADLRYLGRNLQKVIYNQGHPSRPKPRRQSPNVVGYVITWNPQISVQFFIPTVHTICMVCANYRIYLLSSKTFLSRFRFHCFVLYMQASLVRLRAIWMTNLNPSVLWRCWLGYQTCKNIVSEVTCTVLSGTLNLAQLNLLTQL